MGDTKRRGPAPPRPIRVDGDVAYIPLTRGLEAIIDVADVPLIGTRRYHAIVHADGRAYAARGEYVDGKRSTRLMHRDIMAIEGSVDHINGDGLDNRRSNLRECSLTQNSANRMMNRNNRLGIKGVLAGNGRFKAQIQCNGRKYHLGSYDTPEEAAAAYRGAAIVLFGAFARAA